MKPVIVYVDDEPNNLVIFEASLPEDWSIHIFSSPLEAVEKIVEINPWVIVSDQRMPGMTGVKFLEIANQLHPSSIKLITTGYSDENLVIDSIRRAKVFDYIVKPWEIEDLAIRIDKAVQTYSLSQERERLNQEVSQKAKLLEDKNKELEMAFRETSKAKDDEKKHRKELQCWIPPVVTWATKNKVNFPMQRSLALMAIDIVESGSLHQTTFGERSARQKILLEFSMLVIKHGGYVETFQGDAAYANFGLMESLSNPSDAAFAVANEFRAALVGIQNHYDTIIDCGIGLHFSESVGASIQEYSVTTNTGIVIQKRFSTESTGIDLVHRMEKLTHKLPGSNILMTQEFCQSLSTPFSNQEIENIGEHLFKGQNQAYHLFLIKSKKANETHISMIRNKAS